MIEAKDIFKSYGSQPVLNGASLAVAPGEAVILTGDNGSGKTTLLHVLVGLRHPDAGQVVWDGRVLTGARGRAWREARSAWGFLPQHPALPADAPVDRLLKLHARLRSSDLNAARKWLGRVGLAGTEKQRVDELSGGMRQRLGIALALFFQPALIVMDEPGSSLDPGWRGALAEWVEQEASRGAAVLVTSQLHEAWGPGVTHRRCVSGHIIPQATEREAVC